MPLSPSTLFGLLLAMAIASSSSGCELQTCMKMQPELDGIVVIETPNFPSNYTPYSCCELFFNGTQGSRVRIHFTSFDLERANRYMCRTDYGDSLQIFDGVDDTATRSWLFCGNEVPPDIVSSDSSIYGIFRSDSAKQGFGFSANITTVSYDFRVNEQLPTLPPEQCNELLTHAGGAFYSLGFPISYMEDQECIYIVSIPDPRQHILLEPSYKCKWWDYIEVRNGLSRISPLIGRYCGGVDWMTYTQPPELITTAGPDMYVVFYSDPSRVYKGFYAEYSSSEIGFPQISANEKEEFPDQISVCDYSHAPMVRRGGVIVSHHLYPRESYGQELNCSMTFIAQQEDQKIYMQILEMDVPRPEEGQSCIEGDHVRIVDGNLTESHPTILSTVCGRTIKQHTSSSYYAALSFVTDKYPDEHYKGFKLVYSAYYETNEDCREDDFLCINNRCIDRSLVCDDYDHCGDESDEDPHDCNTSKDWIYSVIIVSTTAIIITFGFTIVTCILTNKAEKVQKLHKIYPIHGREMADDDSQSTCTEHMSGLDRSPSTANLPRGDPVNAVSGTLTASMAYLDLELQQAKYITHSSHSKNHDEGKHVLYPKQKYTMFLASGLDVSGPTQSANLSQQESEVNDLYNKSGHTSTQPPPKKRSKHKKAKKRAKRRPKSPTKHRADATSEKEAGSLRSMMPIHNSPARPEEMDSGNANEPPPSGFNGDTLPAVRRVKSPKAWTGGTEIVGRRSYLPSLLTTTDKIERSDTLTSLPPLRGGQMPDASIDMLEDVT